MQSANKAAMKILKDMKIPLHTHIIFEFANKPEDEYYSYDSIERALQRMCKAGKIRRTNPGAYSAYGPERD